jgi:hypothetical protein
MAFSLPALINGKSYENADISVNIGGTVIAGITAINYMEEDNIEGVYGAGRKQVSYGVGQIKPSGSVTMLLEEVLNIIAVSPNGRIQNLPLFNITVSYTDATLVTVTHRLIKCKFKTNKIDTKSGDTSIPVEIPLFIGDIKWS